MLAVVRSALLRMNRHRILVRQLYSHHGAQGSEVVYCWKCERMLKNVHKNTEKSSSSVTVARRWFYLRLEKTTSSYLVGKSFHCLHMMRKS